MELNRIANAFYLGYVFSLGRRFAMDQSMANDAKVSDKVVRWITVNGTHIPIGKSGNPMNESGKKIFKEQAPKREAGRYKRSEQKSLHKNRTVNTRSKFGSASERDRTFKREGMEGVQEKYNSQATAGKQIHNDLNKIAKELGLVTYGKVFGIKGAKSTERKVDAKSKGNKDEYENTFGKLTDIIRFTFHGRHDDLAENAMKTIDMLKKKGYNIKEVDNKYLNRDAVYKGIHIIAQYPHGGSQVPIEIQIHSPEAQKIKDANHVLYEKSREVSTSPEERARLEKQMRDNTARLREPRGIDRLKNFGI